MLPQKKKICNSVDTASSTTSKYSFIFHRRQLLITLSKTSILFKWYLRRYIAVKIEMVTPLQIMYIPTKNIIVDHNDITIYKYLKNSLAGNARLTEESGCVFYC